MEYETDEYLDVLQNIEVGLKEEYKSNNNLTDIKLYSHLKMPRSQ